MVVLLAKFQNGYGFKPTEMQQKIFSSWEAVRHYRSYICFKLTFSIKYKVLEAYFLLILRDKTLKRWGKVWCKNTIFFQPERKTRCSCSST